MSTTKQPYGTVLIKASQILDAISKDEKPLSLNEIVNHTDLTKSTALKILDTLQSIGYVIKDEDTKRYSLGLTLIRYAPKALNQVDIKQIAQPHLEKLNELINETVHLGILQDDKVVYVSKLESSNPIQIYSQIGKSIPLYCSAMGKAILADSSESYIDNYIKTHSFVRKTKNTITTGERLKEEIANNRKLGYSFDDCEHEEDSFCVGASITVKGKNYGAISVCVPKYRVTEGLLYKIIDAVLECRNNIMAEIM